MNGLAVNEPAVSEPVVADLTLTGPAMDDPATGGGRPGIVLITGATAASGGRSRSGSPAGAAGSPWSTAPARPRPARPRTRWRASAPRRR